MKFTSSTLLALVALTSAAPANLQRRQDLSSNELESSAGCKPVSLIMARGSTEGGNMGMIVGAPLCAAMKAMSNNGVACQGIGGDYEAGLLPNLMPKGTDDKSIAEAVKVIGAAMTNCPQAKVVLAGYSQGSAVISQAVQMMAPEQQAKMAAIVFWGYTKNQQTMGMLPGYPDANLKVFCRKDDGVCGGALAVSAGHLAYQMDGSVMEGAMFMISKVGGAATAPAPASAPAAAADEPAKKGGKNSKKFGNPFN